MVKISKELEALFRDAEQKLIGSMVLFAASALILLASLGSVVYMLDVVDGACGCVEVIDGR